MLVDIRSLVRPNILRLEPYRCARDDYQSGILLDANENPYGPCLSLEPPLMGAPLDLNPTSTELQHLPSIPDLDRPSAINSLALHRYPDPHQTRLKSLIASHRNLPSVQHLFTGVGSDEAIDLLIRVFCSPERDAILICPPTYGMYTVSAKTNDVHVLKVPLDSSFHICVDAILESMRVFNQTAASGDNGVVKVVFLCSPGNPTGTALKKADMLALLNHPDFKAILVVDEAYIDFVNTHGNEQIGSMMEFVPHYSNLVVLQTLSKSFGLAGIRMGLAASSIDVIGYMNTIKPPYNISTPTGYFAVQAFSPASLEQKRQVVQQLNRNRTLLLTEVLSLPLVECLRGGLDANFVLVKMTEPPSSSRFESRNEFAEAVYKDLAESAQDNVVIRFRGREPLCDGCLRITVGTPQENAILLKKMKESIMRLVQQD